jgi:hypothetical protein
LQFTAQPAWLEVMMQCIQRTQWPGIAHTLALLVCIKILDKCHK